MQIKQKDFIEIKMPLDKWEEVIDILGKVSNLGIVCRAVKHPLDPIDTLADKSTKLLQCLYEEENAD